MAFWAYPVLLDGGSSPGFHSELVSRCIAHRTFFIDSRHKKVDRCAIQRETNSEQFSQKIPPIFFLTYCFRISKF